VAAAATAWRDKGFAAFKSAGIDPEKAVTTLAEMLDGREAFIRSGSTNMTAMLNAAMLAAFPGAQVSIFNSGSIRIDDTLGPGSISQYDVLRVLPYPGNLFVTTMKGSVLARILTAGRDSSRRGSGAWLQAGGATQGSDGNWTIGGQAIDLAADYRVVMNDYLLNGN
jgi:5'-nucleotidase/UDP-sugar diphosphatase